MRSSAILRARIRRGRRYVLLHHVFGEVNGKKGAWGHAVGGMGAITQAMAAEARARGVEITTGAAVERVTVAGGAARAAVLADGTAIEARCIVSNLNPRLLYLSMIDARELDAEFVARIRNYRCDSATFRMNVALSELPDFRVLRGRDVQPHHQSRHHHGAVARLHGTRLFRCAHHGLVARAGGRDADSEHRGCNARPRRPARREPLLPAFQL